jgi:hypothetical protein
MPEALIDGEEDGTDNLLDTNPTVQDGAAVLGVVGKDEAVNPMYTSSE